MGKNTLALLLGFFSISMLVQASEYMSAEEVKKLMTGKTFDGVYLPIGKPFSAYESPDGTHNVYYPKTDKRSKNRIWFITAKGQHCTANKKWPEAHCSHLKYAGNGEYHKINKDGKHTHILTNFRRGNQL
ncbi:MAG: hypothetical protein P8Y24_03550 [Gammaproteobacteria bacterium]|jgi:hypothetical protein